MAALTTRRLLLSSEGYADVVVRKDGAATIDGLLSGEWDEELARSTGIFDKTSISRPKSPADELEELAARVEAAEGRRAARELRRRQRRRQSASSQVNINLNDLDSYCHAASLPEGLKRLQLPSQTTPGNHENIRRRVATPDLVHKDLVAAFDEAPGKLIATALGSPVVSGGGNMPTLVPVRPYSRSSGEWTVQLERYREVHVDGTLACAQLSDCGPNFPPDLLPPPPTAWQRDLSPAGRKAWTVGSPPSDESSISVRDNDESGHFSSQQSRPRGTVQEMRQEAQRERTEAVYRYRRYLTHRKQQARKSRENQSSAVELAARRVSRLPGELRVLLGDFSGGHCCHQNSSINLGRVSDSQNVRSKIARPSSRMDQFSREPKPVLGMPPDRRAQRGGQDWDFRNLKQHITTVGFVEPRAFFGAGIRSAFRSA